jgi:NitT/TauT family transport system substrate-binding protein
MSFRIEEGDGHRASEELARSVHGELTRQQFLGRCCATCFALATGGSLSSLLAGCGGDGDSGAGTTLRISHLPAGCVQHLLLANKRGMFAKEGLNVKLTQFNGPGENIQAFVAGAHDVMHNPWTNTITAYTRGQKDLRIICGSGKGGIDLVARKGSVKTVKELAEAANTGVKVGTLRLDTLEIVAYGSLRKAGVDYDGYKMTFFPSMVGMGEALIKGQVDVCSLAQPYGATVVDTAEGTYLASSNDVWGPEAADCVVTVKSSFLEKNESALETYLEVLRQAARDRDADYEKAIDELVPVYGVEREVLKSGLDRQVPQPVLDGPGLQSLHNGLGYLIELGYLKQDTIDDVFDGSVQPKGA